MTTTDHTDTHLILEESLRSLTEQERQIVLLSAVSGLNSKEIADITGLSAGGVRSSLSRSLKKLRQQLTS
jgi:RNA polymerase sigma-70 factor (ECF subfamily)